MQEKQKLVAQKAGDNKQDPRYTINFFDKKRNKKEPKKSSQKKSVNGAGKGGRKKAFTGAGCRR